jgi:predicted  nucleic acid-binding Zn-ribbon protein
METSFSSLEEKVLQAVKLIKDLRAENQQLLRERDEIGSRYETLKEDHQRLVRELGDARQSAATVERFEEKRRLIEEKVGGLLEKLEEIG